MDGHEMPDLAFGYVYTLNRIAFASARKPYGQSFCSSIRMVIIGAISVNGAAPITKVEIHRWIGVHTLPDSFYFLSVQKVIRNTGIV